MDNNEERLSVNIPGELHQELKMKAVQEKTTLKAIVLRIFNKYKKEI